MAKRKKLAKKMMNEERFNFLKQIEKSSPAKLLAVDLVKITGYSLATISRVRNSATYEDYRKAVDAITLKQRAKRENEKQTATKSNPGSVPVPDLKPPEPKLPRPASTAEAHLILLKRSVDLQAKAVGLQAVLEENVGRIADALENLVDAWNRTDEKKKGLFGGGKK